MALGSRRGSDSSFCRVKRSVLTAYYVCCSHNNNGPRKQSSQCSFVCFGIVLEPVSLRSLKMELPSQRYQYQPISASASCWRLHLTSECRLVIAWRRRAFFWLLGLTVRNAQENQWRPQFSPSVLWCRKAICPRKLFCFGHRHAITWPPVMRYIGGAYCPDESDA